LNYIALQKFQTKAWKKSSGRHDRGFKLPVQVMTAAFYMVSVQKIYK